MGHFWRVGQCASGRPMSQTARTPHTDRHTSQPTWPSPHIMPHDLQLLFHGEACAARYYCGLIARWSSFQLMQYLEQPCRHGGTWLWRLTRRGWASSTCVGHGSAAFPCSELHDDVAADEYQLPLDAVALLCTPSGG
jgi:hypothetical protein